MNALQPDGGKIYLVLNVPGKPEDKVIIPDVEWTEYEQAMQDKKYLISLEQALSSKIEVAPESIKLAYNLLEDKLKKDQGDGIAKKLQLKEGELYPIEGLEYEIEYECEEQIEGCKSKGCTCKQVAVLNYKQS